MHTAYVELMRRHLPRHVPEPGRALVIGLGAGSMVKSLAQAGHDVHAIELDPGVVQVARDYFGLRPEHARVFVGDARSQLKGLRDKERYDLVVIDAYGAGTPPRHIYNRDAYREVGQLLSPDGVVMINVIARTDPLDQTAAHQRGVPGLSVYPGRSHCPCQHRHRGTVQSDPDWPKPALHRSRLPPVRAPTACCPSIAPSSP